MKGAMADPSVKTMSAPKVSRTNTTGPSHHFLRTRKKPQTSDIIETRCAICNSPQAATLSPICSAGVRSVVKPRFESRDGVDGFRRASCGSAQRCEVLRQDRRERLMALAREVVLPPRERPGAVPDAMPNQQVVAGDDVDAPIAEVLRQALVEDLRPQ